MSLRLTVALFLLLAAAGGAAFAADPTPSKAPAGAARLDRGALDALRGAAPEAEARVVLHWSSPEALRTGDAPQEIATTLRRIEVYAADARVLEATADGFRELPRDRRLHFVGVGTVGQRFGLSLDPDSGAAEGILLRDGRMFALQGATRGGELALDARDMDAPLPDGGIAVGACSGNLSLDAAVAAPKSGGQPLADGIAAGASGALRRPVSFAPKVATRQATVAVDTDNNFLLRKFANNTTNATNYVAALFTALNAIYEDDPAQYGLQLRLVQGTLILRPSTTADPFANGDTSATGAALTEFGGWWRNNQVGVARAFALLLSGNSSNQNSASGIAWLVESGSYCTATGSGTQNFGHYSVNQVFWNPGLAAAQDAYLVAHEIGHNLGARHTHCASAANGSQASTGTIDRCFSGESGFGCYAGTQACASGAESPTAPQGTLMSYCHLNGLGCGVSTEIHPTHVTQLNGRLASQPGTCVSPIGGNTAPAVAIEGGSAAFTENAAPVLVSPNATASDAEGNWTGGSLSVAIGTGVSSDDRLSIGTAGGLSVAGTTLSISGTAFATLNASGGQVSGSNPLVATFTANATNARVQALVRGIQFANVSDQPSTANRNVAFTLRDGGNALATGTSSRTVGVASTNDAPILSLPASIALTEDVAGAVQPVSFTDADAGTGSILATFSVAAGSLSAADAGAVGVGGTPTVRTISGPVADLNAFLAGGGLTYTSAANASGAVTLNVSVTDQGNSGGGGPQSANGSTTLQVAAANDAPTVAAPASLSVLAGATVAVTPVSYADPDAPGGNIAVVATYGTGSGTFAATSGGGVNVAGSGTATLTLTGTLSAINGFLAGTPVQYTASAAGSGVVSLTLSINDQGNSGAGGALTGSATVNVNVTAQGTIFANGFEP